MFAVAGDLPAGLGARVHHCKLRPQYLGRGGCGDLGGEDGWGLLGAAGAGWMNDIRRHSFKFAELEMLACG